MPYSICGTTPGAQFGAARAAGPGCTDCTTQQFSICGTSPQPCTDCTTQQFSLCGTSPGPCTDCTTQQFSICGTSPCAGGSIQCAAGTQCAGGTFCTDCTTQQFSICGTSPQFCSDCTHRAFSLCGVSPIGPQCKVLTIDPWTPHCGGTVQTPCGGSFGDPWKRGGGLTQEGINQIRTALTAQLAALEEAEKKLGPQSVEEIEAREKEINAELDRLKTARANLKKK
ncbi:MAG: hypothetical protein DMF56_09870 [Acidobacteria bacterium]|nr:MAG: hypothetical protein DMF56_09870 [Acidobacteriota bacterium]